MDSDPIAVARRDRLTRIDLAVYGLDAVLKSAYRFTGRCFIHLQHADESTVEVRMRPKLENENPDTAIRDFLNDLIDQRLRSLLAAETAEVRNMIMAHALSRTTLIRPDLETADPKSDPDHASIPDRKHLASS
ncbi:MAG: His-Xaa-Ser system protein HxsD [Lacunisphaera sp.]